jgi:hypothetical protein
MCASSCENLHPLIYGAKIFSLVRFTSGFKILDSMRSTDLLFNLLYKLIKYNNK